AETIVRRKAAEALGKMGADGKSAVQALAEVVKEPKGDRELRNAAVEALGNMGSAAKDALPTLTSLNKKQRDRTFKKLLDEAVKKIQAKLAFSGGLVISRLPPGWGPHWVCLPHRFLGAHCHSLAHATSCMAL